MSKNAKNEEARRKKSMNTRTNKNSNKMIELYIRK